jgi:hypothetical protein
MPRDGAIDYGDLVGKLDVLVVECAKCGPHASLFGAPRPSDHRRMASLGR